MVKFIIDDESPGAKEFIEFSRTLPYVTVIQEKNKSFQEAVDECNAVSVNVFLDELNRRIETWPDENK
ncbi:MAG: hypothetical protein LIO79_08060 [Rikenellaceae bacterium]|nr:hypothetical protein [Rikenellaceae bacterium]